MATIKREIEINDDEILKVEFEGDPEIENDSYDDEYGTVRLSNYWLCQNIDWDRQAFNDEFNKIIDKYLSENYSSIEEDLIDIQKDKEYSF